MLKFIVAFGRNNSFGLELVAMTNKEYAQSLEWKSERANADALDNPDGISFIGTLNRAKSMCTGGTVTFA